MRLSRWLRRHYGIFPLIAESVRVSEEKKVVVTYSSSLAHIYWTAPQRPLSFDEIRADADRRALHYFLVAHAHAHGMTVVTHERPGATKTVKIPDACAALDVRFVDTFAMLRREHARFVLA